MQQALASQKEALRAYQNRSMAQTPKGDNSLIQYSRDESRILMSLDNNVSQEDFDFKFEPKVNLEPKSYWSSFFEMFAFGCTERKKN